MILIHYNITGFKRVADLSDIFKGQVAILMGGAPTIKQQPLELLSKRGVLTMAMNNAAVHFQPTLWVSGDNPECYEPQLLYDPRIMKFAPAAFAEMRVSSKKYYEMPNIFFYIQEDNIPWDRYFENNANVPWYNNTLFVGIHILYQLGVRTIILGGSDFGFPENKVYAHDTQLGTLEQKWNMDLYNGLVKELRLLKPIFEMAGLTLMDCSKNSRISQVYNHITMNEAVDLCLHDFPKTMVDPATLPHCSKFAPESIKERIAKWPGHNGLWAGNFYSEDEEAEMQPLI